METHIEFTKIGFQFSTQDLQRRTLSNTVRSDQTEYLTRSRCRETMKLEGVGRVSMSDLGFQICWQVDNVDGFERTPAGDLVVSIGS